MEKDVLVTIKGLQTLENIDNPEEVELVAKGDYYYRNGHHYIFFEEMTEGFRIRPIPRYLSRSLPSEPFWPDRPEVPLPLHGYGLYEDG